MIDFICWGCDDDGSENDYLNIITKNEDLSKLALSSLLFQAFIKMWVQTINNQLKYIFIGTISSLKFRKVTNWVY